MSLFKNKKKSATPSWLNSIVYEIEKNRKEGRNFCYGYAPVGQEKLLMSLPNDIRFSLEMRIENTDGAEYYYKFYW